MRKEPLAVGKRKLYESGQLIEDSCEDESEY